MFPSHISGALIRFISCVAGRCARPIGNVNAGRVANGTMCRLCNSGIIEGSLQNCVVDGHDFRRNDARGRAKYDFERTGLCAGC